MATTKITDLFNDSYFEIPRWADVPESQPDDIVSDIIEEMLSE